MVLDTRPTGDAPLVPCPLCGYHAPGDVCPHCGLAPKAPTLARRRSGPVSGVLDGLWAVPHGLLLFLRHRRLKRWMLPPLVLTGLVSIALLVTTFRWLDGLLEAHRGGELEFARDLPGWLEGWGWIEGLATGGIVGAEWAANLLWGLVTSKGLALVGYFFVGSLVLWYCFSIVYEAVAGPFLDEVQARLEIRWFDEDPRSRLERPNDLPAERCLTLVTRSVLLFAALALVVVFVPAIPWWTALVALPASFLPAVRSEPRFGPWLRWVGRVEGRAVLASLQASLLTTFFLVLAFPLYFVPVVGYFLFAAVTGFATAVGLLDIPFERRGWSFSMRMRFVGRNLLPFVAFGMVSGALLAVPLFGPVLMVPAASIGGLWLICRLDKAHQRPAGAPAIVASPAQPPDRSSGQPLGRGTVDGQ